MVSKCRRWGLAWRSQNRVDGYTTHLMWADLTPLLFHTRSAARAYANEKYGYIKTRMDLRTEPHGWRMPVLVRVTGILWGAPRPEGRGG